MGWNVLPWSHSTSGVRAKICLSGQQWVGTRVDPEIKLFVEFEFEAGDGDIVTSTCCC